MDTQSYLSFAENDYAFFKQSMQAGMVYNALPAIAQNACEKYLKDIIDRFYEPQTNEENIGKISILRSHSLSKLLRFIEKQMDLCISDEAKDAIEGGDGYYFSTRYPGDNSIEVDERDMRKADKALEYTRQVHRSLENILDVHEQDIEKEDEERCW